MLFWSHSRDAGGAAYRCCSPRRCQAAAFLRVFGHLLLLLTDSTVKIWLQEQHGGGLAGLGWLLCAWSSTLAALWLACKSESGLSLASMARSAFWRIYQLQASLSARSGWMPDMESPQSVVKQEITIIKKLAPRKSGGKRKRAADEAAKQVETSSKKRCKRVPQKGDILECAMEEEKAEGGIEWVKGEVRSFTCTRLLLPTLFLAMLPPFCPTIFLPLTSPPAGCVCQRWEKDDNSAMQR